MDGHGDAALIQTQHEKNHKARFAQHNTTALSNVHSGAFLVASGTTHDILKAQYNTHADGLVH